MSFIQRIDKAAGSLRQASRLDCMTRVIAQCPSTNCRYKNMAETVKVFWQPG